MAKYTKEQLAKMQEEIKRRKEAEATTYKKEMLMKSAIFRKPIGRALKILAWFGLILSTIYFVDIFLSPTYSDKKIEIAHDEILDVFSQDGYHVPVKYYWVYFNKKQDFGIFMFHGLYELAEPTGVIGYGQSPIFRIPTSFRVYNEYYESIKSLEVDYPNTRVLPITIFIVCLLWVLMNPSDNIQFIIYGYFCLFVVPLLLGIFLLGISSNFQEKGLYKMDVKDLRLKSPIEIRK
jgi:hypothetical protein